MLNQFLAIALLVVAYFVLVTGLSLAVRPARKQLARMVHELRKESKFNSVEKDAIGYMLLSAHSMRTPLIVTAVVLRDIFMSSTAIEMEYVRAKQLFPQLLSDPRRVEMVHLALASSAAFSPIFGAIAYLAIGVLNLKSAIQRRPVTRQVATFEAVSAT